MNIWRILVVHLLLYGRSQYAQYKWFFFVAYLLIIWLLTILHKNICAYDIICSAAEKQSPELVRRTPHELCRLLWAAHQRRRRQQCLPTLHLPLSLHRLDIHCFLHCSFYDFFIHLLLNMSSVWGTANVGGRGTAELHSGEQRAVR